jgi:hypothetical protein
MATVIEGYTTEEHHSVVRFFVCAEGLNAKDIHKEVFLFAVGSVCRVKHFSADDEEEDETEARKWLRLLCCGFRLW